MLILKDVKLSLEYDAEQAIKYARKRYFKGHLCSIRISKKSIDARKKDNIYFVYSFEVELNHAINENRFTKNKNMTKVEPNLEMNDIKCGDTLLEHRPIIVGAGPAGLFCAYYLAKYGYNPIIFERGSDIDKRTEQVNTFFKTAKLDENSNVQFGEGGAGAFSDGKLTTRIGDPISKEIIEILAKHSKIESLTYMSHPHIGTDKLKDTVKNLRNEIIEMGGEFHFNKKATDIIIKNNKITGIIVDNEKIDSNVVILACGHSAKDTYKFLHKNDVSMISKPFSVGARIEHFREDINFMQYGKYANHKNLKSAEYQLYHHCSNGHTVYSFCMCPGGVVMPSQSEENTIVVNGMSEFTRDSKNSNSAICVSVSPDDFGKNLFDGLDFIEKIEKNAFNIAGKDYKAPITTTKNLFGIGSNLPEPSYSLGVSEVDFNDILPPFVMDGIKEGLGSFDRKMKGFVSNGAILTGVETRTSSPIKILRSENLESVNVSGLYPCGEGAGYAGGIVSAAADGIKIGKKIIEIYCAKARI
jgi:hypothetical protein